MTNSSIGAPLPFGPQPVSFEVATFGEIEDHNGIRMCLEANQLAIHGDIDGTILAFGIDINLLLEAIAAYTKQIGS